MATESLIIELDAKTSKLDSRLKKTEKNLDKLDNTVTKTQSSFSKLSATGRLAGGALLKIGTAAVAASAVILATSKAVGEYAKELKIASDLSGIGVEQLQLMAYATASVGINLEKLGDISKDTREKIGDFLNTGGGGFQDFADAMKLTKSEAQAVANEFAVMSGPQILQEMVTRMEAANVSAVQMSHALEGMASDTTNLIPLLADGGKKMNELKIAAGSVTIPLTDDDVDLFIRMGASTDLATAALKSLGEQTLIDLGNTFIKVTDTIAYFFATLNEGSVTQKRSRLIEIDEEILALKVSAENANTVFGRLKNTLSGDIYQPQFNTKKQNELLKEQWTLINEIVKLENSIVEQKPSDLLKPINSNDPINSTSVSDIEAIANRFKDEEQLLADKLERELEMVGENKELRLQLDNEYWMNVAILDQDAADKKAKLLKNSAKTEEKIQKNQMALAGRTASTLLSTSLSTQEKLFSVVKDGAASAIEAHGLTAAAKALAELGPIAGAPVAASTIAWSQVAAGVVRALPLGGSSGGGSAPSGSSSPTPNSTQQAFQPETTSLELSDASESGSSAQTINFGTDSGDDLIDAIANALNKAQIEGRA